MTFEEYLVSKKINGEAFKAAESELYKSWDLEFGQMHPNSFTAQKLYLINPLRLKYTLIKHLENKKITNADTSEIKEDKVISDPSNQPQIISPSIEAKPDVAETKSPQISKPARPVFKSKPKTN